MPQGRPILRICLSLFDIFKTASQHYYVQLTSEFELLNRAEQYTDVDTYLAWLEGVINFKNVK